MPAELPDDLYLRWLYRQVASVRFKDPSRTYWSLLRHLYQTEFVWFIPNDDNRVEDGRALRQEFLYDSGIDADHINQNWLDLGCSMLEMLVALSRRLSFDTDGEARAWFWHLLKNIGLDEITDDVIFVETNVDEIVDRVIWRLYEPNGVGGLFPLKDPQTDQTKVELWYQVAAYLMQ